MSRILFGLTFTVFVASTLGAAVVAPAPASKPGLALLGVYEVIHLLPLHTTWNIMNTGDPQLP